MTRRTTAPLFLAAALLLVGAGCGRAPQSAAPAPSPSTNQPAAVTTGADLAMTDSCGNPYYPFKEGLMITYGITASGSDAALPDYTMHVMDVSGTTATIHAQVGAGEVSGQMKADCADGTVKMDGTFDLGSALQGGKMKTELLSSSGTFLPADVLVGATWNSAQSVRTEMTEGVGAGMGPVTTNVSASSHARASESVTVPAGTFDAIKVEITRTVAVEFGAAAMGGVQLPAGMAMPTPPPTVTTTTEWWVKGIGMVKSVTDTQGVTTTVEAKAISGQ